MTESAGIHRTAAVRPGHFDSFAISTRTGVEYSTLPPARPRAWHGGERRLCCHSRKWESAVYGALVGTLSNKKEFPTTTSSSVVADHREPVYTKDPPGRRSAARAGAFLGVLGAECPHSWSCTPRRMQQQSVTRAEPTSCLQVRSQGLQMQMSSSCAVRTCFWKLHTEPRASWAKRRL